MRAKNIGGTTELFSFDESRNETQQTVHAQDAPDFLYDLDDGLPIIVKEVQYFLGYVRYTNQTRSARLAGLTDAEKKMLSPEERVCVFKESFEEHEARTGEKLTQLVWEEEQVKIKQQMDASRQTAITNQAKLADAIASKTQAIAAASGESKLELQKELATLKQVQSELKIPPEYTVKPIPPRLQAVLGK
jgi:hypothetical protein